MSRGGVGLLALVAAAGLPARAATAPRELPALAERVACSPDTFYWRGGRR